MVTTRRTARRFAGLLVPLVLVALLSGCLSSDSAYLAQALNGFRESNGRALLQTSDPVSDRAQAWAETLASEGRLRHSNLKTIPVPFTKAAENVAKASSAEEAHRLLVNSPSHRANMLDPAYTQVGIGTARGADGAIYAVEIFVRP